MSAAKKKGKKTAKTLSLNEFLVGNDDKPAPNYVKSTSWADEMEEEDVEMEPSYGIDRSALPTAPRAARGANVDLDKVPTAPPFTAFLGNLPFDVSVEEIEHFFQKLEVSNVRLIEDNGRSKGYGYAEFATRQALIDALEMDDAQMRGRSLRVNLAEGRQGGERDDRGGRGRKYDSGGGGFEDRSGDDNDWRRKPAGGDTDSGGPRRYDGGGGGGGGGGRRYDDRDDGGRRAGGGGFGGDRDRQNRDEIDSGPWRRGGDGGAGGGGRERNDRFGARDIRYERDGDRDGRRGFGSGYRDEPRRYSPPRDRAGYGSRDGGRRDDYERRDDRRDEAPRERPKLQLQKRSKPVEETAQENQQRSSIFGGAKPVDTVAKELEVERKLHAKEAAPEPKRESKSADIFGAAKPVDTTAREREIEARLNQERKSTTTTRDQADRSPDRRRDRDAGDRARPRRDSRRDSEGDERRERRTSTGSGSGKGPRRESEDDAPRDDHSEPRSPPQQPKDDVKLVPAPPPKENVWAKRKTSAPSSQPTSPQQAAAPTASSQSPPQAASPKTSPPAKSQSGEKKETKETDSTEEDTENTAPGGPPSKTEYVPAAPPTENPWAKRKVQQNIESPPDKEKQEPQPRSSESNNPKPALSSQRDAPKQQAPPNAWGKGAPRGGELQ